MPPQTQGKRPKAGLVAVGRTRAAASVPIAGRDIPSRLSESLRQLRDDRGLTLDQLSRATGVSRAMISKIERGDSMPTATTLGRLAAGLHVGLSELIGGKSAGETIVLKPFDQAVFKDPESGLERRSLSPLFRGRLVDFALNTLPGKASVVFPGHDAHVEECLYVAKGRLRVVVAGNAYRLNTGDSILYAASEQHEFHNEGDETAEFFIVIDNSRAI